MSVSSGNTIRMPCISFRFGTNDRRPIYGAKLSDCCYARCYPKRSEFHWTLDRQRSNSYTFFFSLIQLTSILALSWNSDWMTTLSTYQCTPPNFRVCARRKVPTKRFKICHILYIWKPKVAFSIFHFVQSYIFLPNECHGLCWHRLGNSLEEKIN